MQSSSALTSTRCLPCSIAASATLRAELDLAGRLDDDLDAGRGRSDERRVVGDRAAPARRSPARARAALDTRTKSSTPASRYACSAVLERAVGRRRRRPCRAWPSRTWCDEARARRSRRRRRPTRIGLPASARALERACRRGSRRAPPSSKSGQAASFSETITPSVIGQSMPSAGSSQRMPRSAPGTYGVRDLVADLGAVLERLVAVGAAGRHEDELAVARHAGPRPASGRRSASRAAGRRRRRTPRRAVQRNELRLAVGRDLPVQAADRPAVDVEVTVRLDGPDVDPEPRGTPPRTRCGRTTRGRRRSRLRSTPGRRRRSRRARRSRAVRAAASRRTGRRSAACRAGA